MTRLCDAGHQVSVGLKDTQALTNVFIIKKNKNKPLNIFHHPGIKVMSVTFNMYKSCLVFLRLWSFNIAVQWKNRENAHGVRVWSKTVERGKEIKKDTSKHVCCAAFMKSLSPISHSSLSSPFVSSLTGWLTDVDQRWSLESQTPMYI